MKTLTSRMTDDSKMNLLHLSYFDDALVDVFVPRIPERREANEDQTTPRICTAPTLKGCIASHPTILDHLTRYIDQDADPYQEHYHKHVLLEHSKIGLLLRVYHMAPLGQSVLTSQTVHMDHHVSDALETGEHWITAPCRPHRISYLLIEGVEVIPETNDWKPIFTEYETEDDLGVHISYPDFHEVSMKFPWTQKLLNKGLSTRDALQVVQEANILLAMQKKDSKSDLSDPFDDLPF